MRPHGPHWLLPFLLLAVAPGQSSATRSSATQSPPTPDLRLRIEHFSADMADLRRRHDVPMSGERRDRLQARLRQEAEELGSIDFAALPREPRIDWLLLDNHVRRELTRLDDEERRDSELTMLASFAPAIVALGEAHRRMEPVDARTAAETLVAIASGVAADRARSLLDEAKRGFGRRGSCAAPTGSRTCGARSTAGSASTTAMTLRSPGGRGSRSPRPTARSATTNARCAPRPVATATRRWSATRSARPRCSANWPSSGSRIRPRS